MSRSRKFSLVVGAGLIVAALFAALDASPAAAAYGCGYNPPSCGGNGCSYGRCTPPCPVCHIYRYCLYYKCGCQWKLYGQYYATQYLSNGSFDYGGLFEAQADIENQGGEWQRTEPEFVRTDY